MKNKTRYFHIEVNMEGVQKYSVFLKDDYMPKNANDADIAGAAADKELMDVDHLEYVEKVTEITEDQYTKQILGQQI